MALPPALALERIDFGDALTIDLVRLARSTPVWMGAVAKVVARYPSAFWRDEGPSSRRAPEATSTATALPPRPEGNLRHAHPFRSVEHSVGGQTYELPFPALDHGGPS